MTFAVSHPLRGCPQLRFRKNAVTEQVLLSIKLEANGKLSIETPSDS